ncbi:MAG: hypothetical protein PQJ61_01850 [Spirochaetales bacterium]|uniref:Uncharacterized protein n=1 Tax=Candidatus Thalassospirochaeta sargassi TaxID=3119039 RepID=A0AAJ1ICC7_9SPIO|nr:hypothetical protein [Spirochaetales bacterium]
MGNAITELIMFLEETIEKEKDPAELEELYRTLTTARRVEEHRRNLVCV